MKLIVGMTIVAAMAVAGAAAATPKGVTEKAGAFVGPDGKALYSYARDTTPGKSMCNGGCATAWPPLMAAADAKDDGDWTVVTRDDGSKMWAYKGKPMYAYAKDAADGNATGVSPAWPLATK